MPKTAPPRAPKRRPRTCLNVEISAEHLAILKAAAKRESRLAGRTITPSDLVRDWIWSKRSSIEPERNSKES